jgi:hypothetical protein
MRISPEIAINQGALQETEMTATSRRANRQCESKYFDFECTVLGIAKTIEPDIEKLMAWYRAAPIMDLDALTAERLVHLGRGNEVIAFLESIQVEARQ